MQPKFPIYVPSKGRPEATTIKWLMSQGLRFKVVLEPQDVELYLKNFPALDHLVLPSNNPGHVACARNFIQAHAAKESGGFHWQLDDDIKKTIKVLGGKAVTCSAMEVFGPIEDFCMAHGNVQIASPSYATWAKLKKAPLSVGRCCSSAFLIRDASITWRAVIEDVDYCLQALSSNRTTVLFNHLAIDVASPSVGVNNTSVLYKTLAPRLRCIELTRALWPWLDIRIKRTGTMIDCSRVWRKFNVAPKKIRHAI